jgi:hypothetical protein
LAEQRIVGVVEGEQEGGAMPAPAEGPAKGWGAGFCLDALREAAAIAGGWSEILDTYQDCQFTLPYLRREA